MQKAYTAASALPPPLRPWQGKSPAKICQQTAVSVRITLPEIEMAAALQAAKPLLQAQAQIGRLDKTAVPAATANLAQHLTVR